MKFTFPLTKSDGQKEGRDAKDMKVKKDREGFFEKTRGNAEDSAISDTACAVG